MQACGSRRPRVDLPQDEKTAPEPGGGECRDRHQRQAAEIATHAAVDVRKSHRLGHADRRMQIVSGNQRRVRPESGIALRVVGLEDASLPLFRQLCKGCMFRHWLADSAFYRRKPREHRAEPVGYDELRAEGNSSGPSALVSQSRLCAAKTTASTPPFVFTIGYA